MKNLTIKDIAKMAGVSPTVVYFVLNGKAGVKPETRAKVLEVIDRTNFRPSISSRRLINSRSYNISIIMRKDSSPFSNLFYFDIAKGILESSKKYGYNILFSDFTYVGNHLQLPQIIECNDTDGIILFEDVSFDFLNEIEARKIPYVVLNAHNFKRPNNMPIMSISADYEAAAQTATEFLVSNGHRDIAFLCFDYTPNFYASVFKGFQKTLDHYNIQIPLGWVQITANDEESTFKCVDQILCTGKKPTAFFCASDITAINAMRHLKKLGYSIPNDFSIIGIDDVLLSRYVDPALTTVRIDQHKMGNLALEMIVKLIEGEKIESALVSSTDLIVRSSVKKITTV